MPIVSAVHIGVIVGSGTRCNDRKWFVHGKRQLVD